MLIDEVLCVALATGRFREPVECVALDLAALLDRSEIHIKRTELVKLLDSNFQAVFIEIGEVFELSLGSIKKTSYLLDRELLLLFVLKDDTPFNNFIKSQ